MKFLLIITIFIWSSVSYGLKFQLPKNGNNLVGEVKTIQVKHEENFSDIAVHLNIGYYEMLEANPGIDPDGELPLNTVLIVPTQYILPLELQQNTIVINLAEMRLYFQLKNEIYIFPVGIGKEDWETPIGERTIVKKMKNPTWVATDSIYKFRKSMGHKIERVFPPGPNNPMGKYALFLSGEGYLRIHGTNVPTGIGRRASAGCIRLYDADIETLFNLVEVGTKVIIINKPYKAGWLDKKLYLEAHMPLFEQRLEMGNDMKPALDVVSNAARGHDIAVDWKKVDTIAKEHLTLPRAVN